MKLGDCVKLPDGRLGRVRAVGQQGARVRVRRKAGTSHQFLVVPTGCLKKIKCPKGWMSPKGYRRYLKLTLKKMRLRQAATKSKGK